MITIIVCHWIEMHYVHELPFSMIIFEHLLACDSILSSYLLLGVLFRSIFLSETVSLKLFITFDGILWYLWSLIGQICLRLIHQTWGREVCILNEKLIHKIINKQKKLGSNCSHGVPLYLKIRVENTKDLFTPEIRLTLLQIK